jgi:exodeoxyribonuclease-3
MVTVNISGPSVERAKRLLPFLLGMQSDALVLTETRQNPGTRQLLDELEKAGYTVIAPAMVHPGERGVAIAHRFPHAGTQVAASVELAHRLVIAELDLPLPVTLVGAYVPSRDASAAKIARKREFLEQMSSTLRALQPSSNVILLGDFNIVSRSHRPRYAAFRSWEYDALEELKSHGLVDAYGLLHPGQQVHSWVGRKGSGYRYDYAYLSDALVPRLIRCDYLQSSREQGLTDHAAVGLTIVPGTARNAGHASNRMLVTA